MRQSQNGLVLVDKYMYESIAFPLLLVRLGHRPMLRFCDRLMSAVCRALSTLAFNDIS